MNALAPTTVLTSPVQNPFKVVDLTEKLVKIRASITVVSGHSFSDLDASRILGVKADSLIGQLRRYELALEHELAVETAKRNVVRAFGYTNDRGESWRHWVIFTKEFTQELEQTEKNRFRDAETTAGEDAAIDIWSSFGFDPSSSPLSDFSPTGRSYHNQAIVRISGGHRLITQSGGLDI